MAVEEGQAFLPGPVSVARCPQALGFWTGALRVLRALRALRNGIDFSWGFRGVRHRASLVEWVQVSRLSGFNG